MIIYLIYLHTALLLGLIEPKKTMSAIVRYSYILQTILYRETDYWKANLYDDVKKLDIYIIDQKKPYALNRSVCLD